MMELSSLNTLVQVYGCAISIDDRGELIFEYSCPLGNVDCTSEHLFQANLLQDDEHTCSHAHMYTRMQTQIHMYTRMQTHTHTYTHMQTHTHTHTTHTHTHTHTHNTHTHTHTGPQGDSSMPKLLLSSLDIGKKEYTAHTTIYRYYFQQNISNST